jgi:hypothetical protein
VRLFLRDGRLVILRDLRRRSRIPRLFASTFRDSLHVSLSRRSRLRLENAPYGECSAATSGSSTSVQVADDTPGGVARRFSPNAQLDISRRPNPARELPIELSTLFVRLGNIACHLRRGALGRSLRQFTATRYESQCEIRQDLVPVDQSLSVRDEILENLAFLSELSFVAYCYNFHAGLPPVYSEFALVPRPGPIERLFTFRKSPLPCRF